MSKKKSVVYIASPYSQGIASLNVRTQMRLFDELMGFGFVPVAPLLTHFQDIFYPRKYEDWIEYCLALVGRCDCVLRASAVCVQVDYFQRESLGADREVAEAKQLGIPVFTSVRDLLEWREGIHGSSV